MAESSKVLEGVFAISKPPSLSSAQVLRELQQHFANSKTFAPLLAEVQRRHDGEDRRHGKRRRRDPDSVFKMGHGGTLDPMATGVLIVGIGRGTKHLQNFLGCTKQYDTVVLFGKSTDTYDVMGKVVSEAPFGQITKARVEEELDRFRGDIKQVPPVYSALKINGMKAYDYARSGKELPRELESRDMRVDVCELESFYDGGSHEFRWPIEEAPEDEKAAVQRLMKSAEKTDLNTGLSTDRQPDKPKPETEVTELKEVPAATAEAEAEAEAEADTTGEQVSDEVVPSDPAPNQLGGGPSTTTETKNNDQTDQEPKNYADINKLPPERKAALHTHAMPTLSSIAAPSPAVRVTLTVSSGFYVRSFAHDLGIALNSYGLMAELTRSRQGDYIIPALSSKFPDLSPTLTYEDLQAGEDIWGPILTDQLEKWMVKNPLPGDIDEDGNVRPDDRDRGGNRWDWKSRKHGGRNGYRSGRGGGGGGGGGGGWKHRGQSGRDSR